jgi:hypothetical protein
MDRPTEWLRRMRSEPPDPDEPARVEKGVVWSVVLSTSRRRICATSDDRKSDRVVDGRGDKAVISRINSFIGCHFDHKVWTSRSLELSIS